MKKYFFGLVAVGLAVGFTAFKPFKKATVQLSFDYVNHDVFSQTDVQTAAYWKENVTAPTCNGSAAACTIQVDASNTTGTVGSRILDASKVTIVASGNSLDGYKPNSQAALLSISNKPTP
jgi:hypothetical protein